MAVNEGTRRIVGGVDTQKDLHVAAVVDEQDQVIETRSFATTRQGYRQMLAWTRAFGDLQRIGVEFDWQLWRRPSPFHAASRDCGSRGHNPGQAGSPQTWQERRSRCSERSPCRLCRPTDVTPRSRDGMIESLRVLMACRKTAVSARRVALQMIHNRIVCAPDGLRDQMRSLAHMQLARTLASWRPNLTAYRDLEFRLSHRPHSAKLPRLAASPPPSRSFGPPQAPLPPTICGSA